MGDIDRSADRTAVRSGAEALQRAIEEVSNLTLEDHPDARERIISLLNQVGEKFSDIGDRLADDAKPGETDESGRVVPEDPEPRDRSADSRNVSTKARR
jgi:hypothetical protein